MRHWPGCWIGCLTTSIRPIKDLPRALDDADWVGARLTELLPMDLQEKQALLEQGDPLMRLATLASRLGR